MTRERRLEIAWLAALATVAVALRLGMALASEPPEPFEYERIATNLLAGRGFGIEWFGGWYKTFGSPPFSFLCAGVYQLVGHHAIAMQVVQALCSAGTAVILWAIGRRLFNPAVGWIAAVLMATHPAFVLYDARKLHPLSFDACLAAGGILAVLILRKRATAWRAAWAGALHGLVVFERTTLATIGLLGITALRRRSSWTRWIFLTAVYGTAAAGVLAPWVIRNVRVLGQPVLVTTTGAEVWWRGNNPAASGGAFAEGQPGVPMISTASSSLQTELARGDELTHARAFSREARSFIRVHPGRTARLYIRKLAIFWWFSPYSGWLYPAAYLTLYRVYYAGLLALGLLGAAIGLRSGSREQRDGCAQVLLFIGSVALLQAAFYVEIRHRWGIEPLMLIFSAAGAVHAWRWFAARLQSPGRSDVVRSSVLAEVSGR